MIAMPERMILAAESRGGVRRPPDIAKLIGAASSEVCCGIAGVAQAQDRVGSAVAELSAQVSAAGAMQASAARASADMLAQAVARRGGFRFVIKRGANGLIDSIEAHPIAEGS